jgi:hypothetical protein
MSREDAAASQDAVARTDPELMWLPVIGLDRHTPMIGLRVVADIGSCHLAERGGDERAQQAIYRPITRLCGAPRIPLEADDRQACIIERRPDERRPIAA